MENCSPGSMELRLGNSRPFSLSGVQIINLLDKGIYTKAILAND